MEWINTTQIGDNLDIMDLLPSNSIDLIYCDILYGTGRNFEDFKDLPAKREVIENFYIPRIKEMHRLLKNTGSIYLQMDTKINHWMRCIMDDIFCYNNFINEIIWTYKGRVNATKKFDEKHDIIIRYSKSNILTFNHIYRPYGQRSKKEYRHKDENGYYQKVTKKNKNGMKEYKAYLKEGVLLIDVWDDIQSLFRSDKERKGYYSQKPKALIERIIKASSNKGDLVADFFCGSGTCPVAANELGRNYFACDINPRAIDITNKRLNDSKSLFSTNSVS